MEGNEFILGLLDSNPFSKEPPKFLRVMRYDYRFTTWKEFIETGNWWNRKLIGKYIPFTLKNPRYQTESAE